MTGQAVNGGASVVGKCGLPATNPIFFAFLREAGAAPVLLLMALAIDGRIRVQRNEVPLLILAAFFLFCGQLFFLTGIKMANPVVASAWQPSSPIFVLLIAVSFGWETCSSWKTAGILAAMAGGLLMTLGGAGGHASADDNPVVGNLFSF